LGEKGEWTGGQEESRGFAAEVAFGIPISFS